MYTVLSIAVLLFLLLGFTSPTIIARIARTWRRSNKLAMTIVSISIIITLLCVIRASSDQKYKFPYILWGIDAILASILSLALFKYPPSDDRWAPTARNLLNRTTPLDETLFTNETEYRVGDMIGQPKWRYEYGGKEEHLKNFPNSIASKYMRATDSASDYDVLSQILDSHSGEIPPPDCIVAHVRTGDVVEASPFSVEHMLTEPTSTWNEQWAFYVAPIKYFRDKIDEIRKLPDPPDKIVIVSGSHKEVGSEGSLRYLSVIRQIFLDAGFKTDMRIGRKADDDLAYMCNAKYFLPSTQSGFTKIARAMVLRKGGTVI